MRRLLPVIVVVLIAVSCTDNKETENYTQRDTTSGPEAPKENLEGYSKDFQTIVASPEGVFRGAELGMTPDQLKKTESTLKPAEEVPDHISYMVEYGELEEAEVIYNLDQSGRLGSVEVNVYPKSEASQDSLFKEFQGYFTKRYGTPVLPDSNSRKWEYKNQDLLILMGKKGTQKVHDINIRISYLTREMALTP